ncbi:hypothetical protein [Leptolyngbya sp. Cla-17]|nr:hypothetical protein [Leptolyngbya sp. Cla-17]
MCVCDLAAVEVTESAVSTSIANAPHHALS